MVWTAPSISVPKTHRVHADHARHGDRLGKYAYRVGPAGGDTLGTSREVIDSGK